MMLKVTILVLLVKIFMAQSNGSLTCLQCTGVDQIIDCHNVTKCSQSQICSIEKHLTKELRIVYNMGCKEKDMCSKPTNSTSARLYNSSSNAQCTECCNTTFCNTKGCGDTSYPAHRGPICYTCNLLDDPYKCHNITPCPLNKMCVVMRTPEAGGIRYYSECRRRDTCLTISPTVNPAIIGRRRRSTFLPGCVYCCESDLCNIDCQDSPPLHTCEDKPTCVFLKQRFSVCSDPIVSRDICPESCGLCSTTTTLALKPCVDTFSNCVYLKQHFNICTDATVARQSGCDKTCGICGQDHIDACQSSPCTHGTCLTTASGYNCSCNPGYTGRICDTDMDECASSPCIYGTCNDMVNGYKCTCTPGFTGVHCQTDINECALSPCAHGTCVDGINMFTCICVPGYTGSICDRDIDECASSPCVHGLCEDRINGYTRNCTAGYAGVNCDMVQNGLPSGLCRDEDPCAVLLKHIDVCSDTKLSHELCKKSCGLCSTTTTTTPAPVPCVDSYNNCVYLQHRFNICVSRDVAVQSGCEKTCGFCRQDVDDCISAFCGHGTCIDGLNNFTCACEAGYAGQHCDLDVNECASYPCQHGVCIDGVDQYSCNCSAGYSGPNCEININDCATFPCRHGTCIDGVNSYNCNCTTGFSGKNCDLDVDDCISAFCGHGTCIDGLNNFTCACEAGYAGQHCDLDMNECASYPCQHGVCIDGVDQYSCNCSAGYSGPNCEININDCATFPCRHGTCIDGVNSYNCNCTTGFSGKNCDLDVNECLASPCLHGTCQNMFGGYRCICAHGWDGKNCDVLNHCLSSPCQHGNCINNQNGFTCTCSSGYAGKACNLVDVRDCKDVLDRGLGSSSGVYQILVSLNRTLQQLRVYCDMGTDGGGWTVFQKRFDGTVDFYQNFGEYENGFGDLHSEFWLGLKWMYIIAKNKAQELRIDITTKKGERKYETYHNFSLGPPPEYRLYVSYQSFYSRSGDAGNGLNGWHHNHPFSTKDMPLNKQRCPQENCAITHHGGYWYACCTRSNLNGKYQLSKADDPSMGFYWGYPDFLTASEMKFRRK